MPEGDTVYLAAKRLDAAFGGRTLTSSDFRLPALATADMTGKRVEQVRAYGKHLLFRFEDSWTLHTHFRMDGTWHLYRSGERWRGGPGHQIRIVLTNEDAVAVGYRLHDVALLPTNREDEVIGHLGPDILDDEWNLDAALERLDQAGDRRTPSIAAALTDQRILAGIGNIYRCESLFLAGIHPWLPVAQLPPADRRSVLEIAHRLMMRNRDRASQSTTGDERRAHYVYGRAGRSCLRCGTRIAVRAVESQGRDAGAANEQRVMWCPTCQPDART
jgi:Formamidopyrimidine-DNA glycosylase